LKSNANDNQDQAGAPITGEQLDQAQTMPLGVGNFEEQVAADPLAGEGTHRKRIDSGSLLIGIVIIVAAAGLFSMRTLARVTVPTAGASEFDETIEGFLRLLNVQDQAPSSEIVDVATGGSVLEIINEQYTERQVPLAEVQRNPFIIWTPITRTTTDNPDTVDHLWEQQRAEREAEVRKAAERFTLKSVLMGSTPLANLSDKIVREGESILVQPESVEFRVVSIEPDSVTLFASEPRFELSLQIEVILVRE
jgi:hypothetical protein